MRGQLWRVSSENMTAATNEQAAGIEVIEPMLGDLKIEINRRRRKLAYRDLRSEVVPDLGVEAIPLAD